VIRLSRAGRKQAIVNAIRSLNSKKVHDMWTRGEICRKMGVISTSKIRDILKEMVDEGVLVDDKIYPEEYNHSLSIYGIPTYEQIPLPPEHVIAINGVNYMTSGERV